MLLLIIPNKSSMMLNKKNHLTNDMYSKIKDLSIKNYNKRKNNYRIRMERPKNVRLFIVVV
jgi:hypothetical protein